MQKFRTVQRTVYGDIVRQETVAEFRARLDIANAMANKVAAAAKRGDMLACEAAQAACAEHERQTAVAAGLIAA